jgi:hypothetical protein
VWRCAVCGKKDKSTKLRNEVELGEAKSRKEGTKVKEHNYTL